jgi:hypothetical protein
MDILGLFSRRNMLVGLGGAAAAAGAVSAQAAGGAGVAGFLKPAGHQAGPLDTATYADWSAQVGTHFKANTGHVLKLAAVQAYPGAGSRPRGLREQGFLARFDIVRGEPLSEGRYIASHPSGGVFAIFLTKAGADMPLRMLADFN